MNVTLYSNSGDPRQINKNLTTLGNAKTANATESIDVLRPTLKLVYDSNIIGANYLYIDTFGRYYFIDEKSIEGNLMTVSCHVDVLMSHRNAILNSYCIAARSASTPEPFIPDPVCSDKGTVTYYTRRCSTTPFNGSAYVLSVAGK